MNDTRLDGLTAAFGISLVVTSIASAVLVVLKESYAPLMAWMNGFTGNHWITQGVLNVVLFIALGFVLASIRNWKLGGRVVAWLLVGATVLSGAILAGFFLLA